MPVPWSGSEVDFAVPQEAVHNSLLEGKLPCTGIDEIQQHGLCTLQFLPVHLANRMQAFCSMLDCVSQMWFWGSDSLTAYFQRFWPYIGVSGATVPSADYVALFARRRRRSNYIIPATSG